MQQNHISQLHLTIYFSTIVGFFMDLNTREEKKRKEKECG
jgi:hypothetical protein